MSDTSLDAKAATAPPKSALRWLRSRRAALGILVAFSLVAWAKPMGLLLWARIRILTNIPRTAIADDPANVVVEPPRPVEIDAGLSPAAGSGVDPFRIDPSLLPASVEVPAEPRADAAVHRPKPPDADAATPATQPAPAPPSAEELRVRRVREIALARASLRLQSASRGLSTVVIDGRILRLGDLIDASGGVRFRLAEILDGGAILECEGERVEVRLRSHPMEPDAGSP